MGGSTSNQVPPETHVVILGAGYAGTHLGKKLLKIGCRLTIIDQNSFFHQNVASLRACVEPGVAKRVMIPLKEAFPNSFIQGKVVSIEKTGDDRKLKLESGEEVNFTHLVLATGSTGPFPGKLSPNTLDHALELYSELLKQIMEAESIVVVGGGAVGTELAAEIATDYRAGKVVTLIHSQEKLVTAEPGFSDKFQNELQTQLRKKGVSLILGEKVVDLDELPTGVVNGGFTVRTDKGQEVKANLLIRCTGLKPTTPNNIDWIASALDENGRIKVNEYFEVEGCEGMFAIGDCCSYPETKMAFRAQCNGDLVFENLIRVASNKEKKKYDIGKTVMIVSLGRNGGVSQFGNWVLGSFASKNVKSKDMFVPRYWNEMGVKMPSK